MFVPSSPKSIFELQPQALRSWLAARDVKPYRADQILKWIYFHLADSFDAMSDLSKDLRRVLADHFSFQSLERRSVEASDDGSRKYLFELHDNKCVESVLIPERDHLTLCISSQVGCAQGCRFCLTGQGGFVRNLSQGEILGQVYEVLRDLARSGDDARKLTNLVFMGMGEPLANYSHVIRAIRMLTECESGFRFSNRKVTVSTAGLIPRLFALGRDAKVNLAVSLNATENSTRSMLMPLNRQYPIEDLLQACRAYPLRKGRRITFEYILIKGVNDAAADARRLVKLLRPIRSKINLIPFNEHAGCQFQRSDDRTVARFQQILQAGHYTAIIRHSKGRDISAACGQLSAKEQPLASSCHLCTNTA